MSITVQEPNRIEVTLVSGQGPAGPSTLQAQAAAAQANQSRIEAANFAQASEDAALVSINKAQEAAQSAANAAGAAANQVALHEAKSDPHGEVYLTPARGDARYAVPVLDESTLITNFMKSLKFTGAGVTATQVEGNVTVNIPGGGTGGSTTANPIQVHDEGSQEVADLEILDFVGAGVSVTPNGRRATIEIPGPSEQTAFKDQANTYTKAQVVSQVSVPFATNLNIDASLGNAFRVAPLTGNTTLPAPTNLVAGGTYLFIFRQDAVGGRTVTFNSIFRFLGGVTQIDQGADKISVVSAYFDGTNLIANIAKETA